MKLKSIIALGVVEALATLALNEGLKYAKENAFFEKAKNRFFDWAESHNLIDNAKARRIV